MSSALFLSSLPFSASAESINMTNAVKSLESGVTISADHISTDNYKDTRFNNPISPDFFCADPTAVEYNHNQIRRNFYAIDKENHGIHYSVYFYDNTLWNVRISNTCRFGSLNLFL